MQRLGIMKLRMRRKQAKHIVKHELHQWFVLGVHSRNIHGCKGDVAQEMAHLKCVIGKNVGFADVDEAAKGRRAAP